MEQEKPTIEEWRALYQAAGRVKEAAPWTWMEEADVFGVQNPETQQLGFVSIMGLLGEHYAVPVYLGAEGLSRFWEFENNPGAEPPEEYLNIRQLQLSFEDRDELTEQDREVIKELGLKFRGRKAWPKFRSYRPGYCPWYLEPAEARFLTYALQQAVEVALRFREDPATLAAPDEHRYLVRVPRQQDGAWVWEDRVMDVPPVEREAIRVILDRKLFDAAKAWPHSDATIEADVFMMPGCFGERGERPSLAYDMLVVDSSSGLILGTEVLDPRAGLAEMWGSVPARFLAMLSAVRMLPREVRVHTRLLLAVLRPVASQLGFAVTLEAIPAVEQAKKEMLGWLVG